MPNTFFGLTIGKSGLYTYQGALNTTAHNIANEKTTGYSRQQTVRSATTALSLPGGYGMAGTGVNIDAVEQIRNEYYDVKYWNSSSKQGEYGSKYDYS
jgi:flagellar hook-associated protein 1 FlgK